MVYGLKYKYLDGHPGDLVAQCRRKLFSSASIDSKRAGIIHVLIASQDQGVDTRITNEQQGTNAPCQIAIVHVVIKARGH